MINITFNTSITLTEKTRKLEKICYIFFSLYILYKVTQLSVLMNNLKIVNQLVPWLVLFPSGLIRNWPIVKLLIANKDANRKISSPISHLFTRGPPFRVPASSDIFAIWSSSSGYFCWYLIWKYKPCDLYSVDSDAWKMYRLFHYPIKTSQFIDGYSKVFPTQWQIFTHQLNK